ncbi:Elongation of very long chain fatty acids protein 6 [Halotydeus destructor]|nr:Elongation of very long chain fatty acids protein 6 [Halotydeus destructor]
MVKAIFSYDKYAFNGTFYAEDQVELYVKHPFELAFERSMDAKGVQTALRDTFHSWIYFVICAYLVVIFCLKKLMVNRQPFDLRRPLLLWNTFLALFSAFGALRTMAELGSVLVNEGITGTICHPGHEYGAASFWTVVFCLSKIPEMVDTVLIVLRKRPLIFLHWYHHVETCFYSIYAVTSLRFPVSRWFVSVNYTVHAFMYTYYALRAAGVKVPRGVAMAITSAQVSQMFLGLYVVSRAYVTDCHNDQDALLGGLITYSIYAIMFTDYFVNSYFKNPKDAKKVD